jgi:adenylate kinase family enzyme
MIKRIHILGASGSGTSTLGKALAEKLNYTHFDTDDYYWLPPKYSFTQKRELVERQNLLMNDLMNHGHWVLSGSLCDWGDIYIPLFDMVIYLWIPQDIRIDRVVKREEQRHGDAIKPSGHKYSQYIEFIEWASKYDEGGLDMRSKATHEEWLKGLKCPFIRIEGDLETDERMELVLAKIDERNHN